MSKSYILGIHGGHDATVCLIDENAEVVYAVAEERVTRIKYHMGFPYDGIQEMLDYTGVSPEQIKIVAGSTKRLVFPDQDDYNDLLFTKDKERIKSFDFGNELLNPSALSRVTELVTANLGGGKQYAPGEFAEKSERLTIDKMEKALSEGPLGPKEVVTYDHHLCHAASAYYCSGKEDALIITMDGAGDGLCASANVIENGKIVRVAGASADVSPGRFYSEVTGYAGFKRLRHEGKITGLAAYGDPERFYADFRKYLRFNPNTDEFEFDMPERSALASKWKTFNRVLAGIQTARPHIAEFNEYLSKNAHPKKDMQDMAAAAQRILEEIAVEYVAHYLKKYPNKNVLLAGGVFANVRVNQLIGELPEVEFVYIHQNMGDGGLALGAAMLAYHDQPEAQNQLYTPLNVYFGHAFDNDQIGKVLDEKGIKYQKVEDVEPRIAELINDGKVIGRFYGGMEYGPRALGNRSILAQPTDKTINDWLNKKLNRTEFMPFAPSVLGEKAGNLLVGYENASSKFADNFMTITYHVKDEWQEKTQATTHVDGTARPQVVFNEANPSYHRIIEEYDKLSGIPAIINTSFNMHEEPIVRTPEDAVRAFSQGCLDYLAIGNYICSYEENFG